MNTIVKRKPSELPEFQVDIAGNEIMQITREGVGTYQITANRLRGYFGGAPVVLTQAEYDALEIKDFDTTYYIIEE